MTTPHTMADTLVPPPTVIVILGGTGNLAETKLLPALYDLYRNQALPTTFQIIGVSRKKFLDAEYGNYVAERVRVARPYADEAALKNFSGQTLYLSGDLDTPATYAALLEKLGEIDNRLGISTNKLVYIAMPPQYYAGILAGLATSGIMTLGDASGSWSRLLIEKPFGRDLSTAEALEQQLQEQFEEAQVYRIDHYLAKDAIENILALRFGNSVLRDSWHQGEVESIAVRLLETKDVSSRGAFYDGIGALRDVGQNHVLQILALLTMEAVDLRDVRAVRQARARVLGALTSPTEIIRGQYGGYKDTKGVATDSVTETYFKMTTTLDLPAWLDVPITLEAGKALDRTLAEAVVVFKGRGECHCAAGGEGHTHQNVLTFTFSPEQKITLKVFIKRPGFVFSLEPRELELGRSRATDDYSPEAYERVLYDCLVGDQSRFVSGEEVMKAWKFITPMLDTNINELHLYAPGSSGPKVM